MVVEKRFLIIAVAGMSAALSLHGHPAFADDDGDGSSAQAALLQAEAQAEVAKSTAAAAAALASLAEGPVHPMMVVHEVGSNHRPRDRAEDRLRRHCGPDRVHGVGNAVLFSNTLSRWRNTEILQDSEFANARGLLKFARSQVS